MKTGSMKFEKLFEDFLQVLDDDILNLELSLIRLDELRSAVIKRDDELLKALVETIRIQAEDHEKVKAKRDKVLGELAVLFNIERVDISFLADNVDSFQSSKLLDKQKKVKELVKKMNVEYSSTFMFMREFSRINKMLLNCFIRPEDNPAIYDNKGKRQQEINSNIISGRI